MGKYIAEQAIKQMIACGSHVHGAKVNVLGPMFKNDCTDLRNSKVGDIVAELESYGIDVAVHEPWANADEAWCEYGVELTPWAELPRAEAIGRKTIRGGCFIDVKSRFDEAALRVAGLKVWRL